jgi:hypothetical protein
MKEKSGYIPNGDTPFTPNQLRAIRQKCLSTNSLWDFQFYTMLLISCRQFHREDEIADMSFNDINPDITTVKSGGRVMGIAYRTQGKSDPVPVTLLMWNDDIFPEFCPVRHLLAWLGMTKISSGFFFPSKNRLQYIKQNSNEKHDIKESDRISYQVFLNRIKKICTELDFQGRWGCQTGRKTGYLFGTWAGASDTDLMQSARHRSVSNAMKYKRDASFLISLAEANGNDLSSIVPKWRNLYTESNQLAIDMNATNRPNFVGINGLARTFISHHLRLPNHNTWIKSSRVIGIELLI